MLFFLNLIKNNNDESEPNNRQHQHHALTKDERLAGPVDVMDRVLPDPPLRRELAVLFPPDQRPNLDRHRHVIGHCCAGGGIFLLHLHSLSKL